MTPDTNTNVCIYVPVYSDIENKLSYAEGCYQYKNYCETVDICNKVLSTSTISDQLNLAKLLKGKALFYVYQPMVCYLMKHRQELERPEERILKDECFLIMKEAIQILGTALDLGYLDSEGSKLLDWAMMDCIRETNQLNLCRRCLLCRASRNLRRSHIWPKFNLQRMSKPSQGNDSSPNTSRPKKYAFGLDKYQFKSAGECWFWMFCSHCEETITQNAENDFSLLFPKDGSAQTINYGPWLFNYCCSIILRTIAFAKFPHCFNDHEIYDAFVFCRNHLLSLQVKVGGEVNVNLAKFIFQKYHTKCAHVKPYLFVIPPTVAFHSANSIVQPYINSCSWLSPHRLIDGMRDFSGLAHFFAAYCNNICILIKFSPSSMCTAPNGYEVTMKGGQYTIESEANRISAIPNGLWMLWNRMVLLQNQDFTKIMRGLSTNAARKLSSSTPNIVSTYYSTSEYNGASFEIPQTLSSIQQFNLLPSGFMLTGSALYTSQKKVKFPEGHQVVFHRSFEDNEMSLLCFLAIDSANPVKPYTVFALSIDQVEYCDGAFLSLSNEGNIQLSDFLLQHDVVTAARSQLSIHHETITDALSIMLITNGMVSLEFLIHCLSIYNSISRFPPISSKCSPEGCWHCQELCHYCMKPDTISYPLPDGTLIQCCSKICYNLLCASPDQFQKSLFVLNRCVEEGDYSGISMLHVLHILRSDDCFTNKFEVVYVCNDPANKPFIFWQTRSKDTQKFASYYISQSLELLNPTDVLSKSSSEFSIMLIETIQKHESYFKTLLNTAVQSLGYKCFSDYLTFCYSIICKLNVKSLSINDQDDTNVINRQVEKKFVISGKVSSLPTPKIIIPNDILMGISITSDQCVEVRVDLSELKHHYLDVSVTSPFKDVFNIQP